MKKTLTIKLVVVVIVFLIALFISLPHENGLRIGNLTRTGDLYLGLDLQGGMQVLLEADVDAGTTISAEQLNNTRQILENRSNGLGVGEITFQTAGNNRIIAEFPGLTDTDEVLATLKGTGLLEFVDTGDESFTPGTPIKTDTQAASESVESEEPSSPETEDPEAPVTEETIYHTVLTGSALDNVSVQMYNTQPVIAFSLNSDAAKIFSDFTTNNIRKYLTIVLDGEVISSPVIENAITDGQGVISGNFTIESANALAVQLRYGALPVPLRIVEYKLIGATLGDDSLRKSLVAGIIGLCIAALFMLIYYRLPGLVGVLEIIFYIAVSLALYKLIPVTLSLSGIAGFLLTTGGAFDANILMFERLKEELRNGKSISESVGMSWPRAWSSIRDSNVATLITAAILFFFGSSFGATIVKGFAVSLFIGVIISVLSAYLVTNSLLHLFTKSISDTPENKSKWFGI